MGLYSCRPVTVPMLTHVSVNKSTYNWHMCLKLNHVAMEEVGLVNIFFTLCEQLGAYVSHKWHLDALWEKGKLAETV